MIVLRPGVILNITRSLFLRADCAEGLPAWDRRWEDPRGNHQLVGRIRAGDVLLVVAVPPPDRAGGLGYRRRSMLVVLSSGVSAWVHSDELAFEELL